MTERHILEMRTDFEGIIGLEEIIREMFKESDVVVSKLVEGNRIKELGEYLNELEIPRPTLFYNKIKLEGAYHRYKIRKHEELIIRYLRYLHA